MKSILMVLLVAACAAPVAAGKEPVKSEMSVSEVAAKTEAALDGATDECLREPECVSELLENI